jgi:hypothetical protein
VHAAKGYLFPRLNIPVKFLHIGTLSEYDHQREGYNIMFSNKMLFFSETQGYAFFEHTTLLLKGVAMLDLKLDSVNSRSI